MTPAIDASGWGWRHAGRESWAVRGLDLVVEEGERVLLLGPSGAGKSTLLNALAGLLRAPEAGDEEGRLLVEGENPAARRRGRDRRSAELQPGIVFQEPSSSLVMARIGDEVAFGLENLAVERDEIWRRVAAALATVCLPYPLDHSTNALSGGEQQRLAIADVLAAGPRIWLLDEPTANLDPSGAAAVRATLRDVLERTGSTLVIVEHRVSALVDLVNRVVVLEPGGGVAADGPPEEIFAGSRDELRRAGIWVPGSVPARIAATRPRGRAVVEAAGVSVSYEGAPRPALEGASVAAYEGEVLAVTGENGSGKTSLALVLSSLLEPGSGSVRFLAGGPDLPYRRWRARDLVSHVGTVFQEPEHQFVASTVADELAVSARRAGMDRRAVEARTDELLSRLGLTGLSHANPFTLSGGEKRRLSVATALATTPELLVLDEPTFGQDARTWDELVALLAEQRDEARAIVAVTHDEELVASLADRRVSLSEGRIVDEQRVDDAALAS